MDSLYLLAVQGTLKSLLQHHTSKASILQLSAFFIVQLSHPYMTTRKTIALTRWTFVGKVIFLVFNMLSRLVIIFLPRSKHLLISWLQSPSAMILEPKKIKSVTISTVSASIYCEVMGPDAIILVFWMLSFKPTFSLFFFIFIKSLFSSSLLSVIRVVLSAYLGKWSGRKYNVLLTLYDLFEREKLHLNYFIWLMTVIYNFLATSILGIPLEKVYGFITYSNVLFIDYKIKSSMYLLILFKLTCLYT